MVTLQGSDRQPFAGAVSIGAAHPDERLEVTLVLRPNDLVGLKQHVENIKNGSATPITHSEYAAKYATTDADVRTVTDFAAAHNLTVVDVNTPAHRIIVQATVAHFNAAFGVQLETYSHAGGTYRGRVGSITLPQELDGVIDAVLGLDNRPAATPHFRSVPQQGNIRWHAANSSFYPNTVADLYNFPPGDGAGECVGIIELGGGYRSADLESYFVKTLKFPSVPNVKTVSVAHGSNAPTGSSDGPDGEVMLDIEVVGAIVPAATIAVYFTSNTDAGFLNAITTAMHDSVNRPSVISISWGGPEDSWTTQALRAYDAAFAQAALLGITVTVASGDNGSSDGETDGSNHVDFPASSPHAVACGGTNIQVNNKSITNETVWNGGTNGGASGGGFSKFFPTFAWQKNLQYEGSPLPKRGVPDVAGDADPASGYIVQVDGQLMVIGGTSAVAPLWAALFARINANQGHRVGYVHQTLYANPQAFNDVTVGNNGSFAAGISWDAATGLGSPNGQHIATAFTTPTT
jgi:kumamolisin